MNNIDWNKIRNDFPILNTKFKGMPLVYLDNSATSQKPQIVIDAICDLYSKYNANIHRGIYRISEETTQRYEDSKKVIAKFINAPSYRNIIYTRNTTESINQVALMLEDKLNEDDEIVITNMEHHSNLIPWMKLAERTKSKLVYINATKEGEIDINEVKKSITEKTRILAITHVSNVLGTINNIKEIVTLTKEKDIYSIIDGAQAVGHIKVDLKDIDPDFYAFSGHKMLAPTGIGVLYIKDSLLTELDPIYYGGDMISNVELYSIEYNSLPWKFEAGTSNYEGAIAFAESIKYIESIGIDNIQQRVDDLNKYLNSKITEIPGIKVFGTSKNKIGVTSFTLENIHPHDIAGIMSESNICIRAGNHCANPLVKSFNVNALARASLYFYNNTEDIDKFIDKLYEISKYARRLI